MDTSSKAYQGLLKRRPLNVRALWEDENVALVSGRDIYAACKELGCIALAANARNPLTAKGVLRAAKKLDAAVVIEVAKSENDYCFGNFENLPSLAVKFSKELGDGVVFAMHVDHYAIKGPADVNKAVSQIPTLVERGWTSVAIDASHLRDYDNLMATRDVAMSIPAYLGLEAEVGEIKGPGVLSTVEDALYFIGGLNAWGIYPDLLAISNGSQHGTYDTSLGQAEGIDLQRTLEIAKAVAPFGVSIAQHGISGTALSKVEEFHEFGINKGNVATLFQNVVFGLKMDPETGNADTSTGSYVKESGRGVSDKLWASVVSWADGAGMSRKSGDYKKANLPFGKAVMSESDDIKERIVAETEEWATRFIKAMKSEGSAERVLEVVNRRSDHNSAPERRPLNQRSRYGRSAAPDAAAAGGSDGKDYSD
ncbi:MAG: class II fructose-bisphosphate aldolase [Synergistaceae bacterium]|jgi:fructose/tagatose bisphosphate aldolase|nr:class II fructose-bisphosphate aldolase [Synergistaceae bacterium]